MSTNSSIKGFVTLLLLVSLAGNVFSHRLYKETKTVEKTAVQTKDKSFTFNEDFRLKSFEEEIKKTGFYSYNFAIEAGNMHRDIKTLTEINKALSVYKRLEYYVDFVNKNFPPSAQREDIEK